MQCQDCRDAFEGPARDGSTARVLVMIEHGSAIDVDDLRPYVDVLVAEGWEPPAWRGVCEVHLRDCLWMTRR
jgi:hypothetical protein